MKKDELNKKTGTNDIIRLFLFCILALFLTLIVAALLSPFILAQKISFLTQTMNFYIKCTKTYSLLLEERKHLS